MNDKMAFTLMELMLVVIVIGVLVAMVVPRLSGRSEQAKQAAARADIEANIATALDFFNYIFHLFRTDKLTFLYIDWFTCLSARA